MVDKVKNKEIEIKYCPTEFMIADYFTKPLQGKMFRAMRKVIMGHEPLSWLLKELSSTKERVGKKENVKFIDVNNCANDKIEKIEKTDKKVMSYADEVTNEKSNRIAKSEYRSLTNLR